MKTADPCPAPDDPLLPCQEKNTSDPSRIPKACNQLSIQQPDSRGNPQNGSTLCTSRANALYNMLHVSVGGPKDFTIHNHYMCVYVYMVRIYYVYYMHKHITQLMSMFTYTYMHESRPQGYNHFLCVYIYICIYICIYIYIHIWYAYTMHTICRTHIIHAIHMYAYDYIYVCMYVYLYIHVQI